MSVVVPMESEASLRELVHWWGSAESGSIIIITKSSVGRGQIIITTVITSSYEVPAS
jgi:hypothetical protein